MKRRRLVVWLVATSIFILLVLLRRHLPDAAPKLLPSSAIFWLWESFQLAYVLCRRFFYVRRELRRTNEPAYDLKIPEGTKSRAHYPGAEFIHEVQSRFISEAVDAQGSYFRTGILAAMLPPLALLALSSQLLIFPAGGTWAVGLIIAELACLGRLAFIALTQQRPTARWIAFRLRAELMRREEYLLIAQIGPYLGLEKERVLEEADRRMGLLSGAEESELRGLVPSHSFFNTTFLKYQPRADAGHDLLDRVRSYLYLRVGKQVLWFSNEIRDCEENESLWSKVLVSSLLFALVVAVAHLIHLSHDMKQSGEGIKFDMPGILIGVMAVLLPPAATAIISIKNMYAFNGRTHIYERQAANLLRFDGELRAVLRQLESQLQLGGVSLSEEALAALDHRFRLLALLTEMSLANEMEKWTLLMERESIEVNA